MKKVMIGIVKGPYNFTYYKNLKSKVFRPIELSTEIYNKITPLMDYLEVASKKLDKPIQFYPKYKDITLMNVGAYTSVIKNSDTEDSIRDLVVNHLLKVYRNIKL